MNQKKQLQGHGYFRKKKWAKGLASGIALGAAVITFAGATGVSADETTATTDNTTEVVTSQPESINDNNVYAENANTSEGTLAVDIDNSNVEAAAKEAGADYVGLDEYIEKIKGGWTDIDVIITMPSIMGKIGALGRVLGPRGLMPNPKSGTVTMDVAKAVKEVKQGKIDFKVDKSGIVHTSIGKVSFSPDQIRDNAKEFISTLNKLKPTAAKGTYIKSIYLSSTMSAGIKIDPKSVDEI